MCLWNMFRTQRKFQSECSDDVLKNTSKGMKFLMPQEETFSLVDVVWRQTYEYSRNTLMVQHIIHSARSLKKKILCDISRYFVYNTKDLVSLLFVNMLSLFAPPTHVHRYRKKFCTCKDGTYHLESIESIVIMFSILIS